MHTYEIYYAVTSCDCEWQRLGEVQSDTQADALSNATQRWQEYPPELLIAVVKCNASLVAFVRATPSPSKDWS